MTDLHKSLRHILAFHGVAPAQQDQAIADIMGAVQKDGYTKKYKTDYTGKVEIPVYAEPPLIIDTGAMRMTGPEWYSRFEKAADVGNVARQHPANYEYYKAYFKVIAKRAAGLEDQRTYFRLNDTDRAKPFETTESDQVGRKWMEDNRKAYDVVEYNKLRDKQAGMEE